MTNIMVKGNFYAEMQITCMRDLSFKVRNVDLVSINLRKLNIMVNGKIINTKGGVRLLLRRKI